MMLCYHSTCLQALAFLKQPPILYLCSIGLVAAWIFLMQIVDIYYIVPNKCTECQGFHEEPQCAAVCPVDCCVPDEMYRETVEELLAKKDRLHL